MLDDKEIGRYVDQRREQVDSFIADHFSCRGTFRVFWSTLKTDVVRHPINFVLAIPFLFVGKAASWLEKLGWYSAAKILNRVPLRLRTGFENSREEQVVVGLLGLSDEMPELRQAVDTPINSFMATRAAILDLASGGLTIAVAYALFGRASLSPYEMAHHLAASSAREQAASHFVLGRGIGGAFYDLFPPEPTAMQLLTSTVLMFLLLGVLTTLLNVFSDPAQKSLGILRRQLNRLLDGCEENLLLAAVKKQRDPETGRGMGGRPHRQSAPRPIAFPDDLLLPPRSADPESSPEKGDGLPKQMSRTIVALASLIGAGFDRGRIALASLIGAGFGRGRIALASLIKVGFRRGRIALTSLTEGGFGRGWILLGGVGISAAVALIGFWAYQWMNPYLEVQRLIERKAFVTAVARLEQLPKRARAREGEGEYWYWRGRALMGNKQLDGAIEAYQSATAKAARYRKDSSLIRDATDAVASKDHEKAKLLLLEQIGPIAIQPLLEKVLAKEEIHRWSLVELIKKLGGEDQLNYQDIAIIDLAAATTCQGKKRALEKISEYSVKAAIPTLHQLQGQAQFKCLQNALKPTLAKLESAR
ncbi:MAG TPA: DUF6635 family protein [Myxococcaceae bacterium]|nr:DUF6635 family protein [Myxococcaceae bacterium]